MWALLKLVGGKECLEKAWKPEMRVVAANRALLMN
jgi:hypothetical protein